MKICVSAMIFLTIVFGVNTIALGDEAHHYFGQTNDSYQSKIDYGNNASAGRYVKSNDAKIYYEIYGQGRPVVLLHGGLVGSPAEMSELADKLNETRQVILIATRGHARSEIGYDTPSYEQKAEDLNAVLVDLAIEKVDLIGFSDGAYTAYFFAKKYPQKVINLVSIGAGTWKKGFVQGGRSAMKSFEDLENFDKRYWSEQKNGIRPEPSRISEWFESVMKYYDSVVIDENIFKNIRSRSLVIAGEKDANAPLDTIIEAYKMFPNAQLGIIPNAPHSVLLTDFDMTWSMIRKFLMEK